jgi:hypothetical protein
MRKKIFRIKRIQITIGITVFFAILINLSIHSEQLIKKMKIDEFSVSLVVQDKSENDSAYFIEVEPNKLHFYKTKLLNYLNPLGDKDTTLFRQIELEQERRISDKQMYHIIRMFQKINLNAERDVNLQPWHVSIQLSDKRYELNYSKERKFRELKNFVDMLMRYISSPEFEIKDEEYYIGHCINGGNIHENI